MSDDLVERRPRQADKRRQGMSDIQIESMVTITGAEYEALRADKERLRKALEPFACTCSVKGMGAFGNCTKGSGECACWNVRTALKETK